MPRRGRRRFLRLAIAGAVGVAGLSAAGAWYVRGRDAYRELVADTWRDATVGPELLHELVRCGTLAPNSHNTQPWRFAIGADSIRILPDTGRRTPVVDPDDHHLFASLGCAAETMVQAAPAIGLTAEVEIAADGVPLLRLAQAAHAPNDMSGAIARRHSTRAAFDPAPLASADLAALEAAGGGDDRVDMLLLTDARRRASLAELILAGNSVQIRDRAFIAELKSWIRFSHAEALASRDGLFAASTGNPVLPALIGRNAFDYAFTLSAETDRLAIQLSGTSGFAIFAAAEDNPAHWVAAGRAAQRFCLRATALGLKTAWVNQPVEVPALRPVLASWLGLGERQPDLVLRFGRGPDLPPSLRRSVADVVHA